MLLHNFHIVNIQYNFEYHHRCCLLRLGTMKLVFYLPILTIIITCGTTNGVEQTCETRCISDCEASCPDAKVCSDNEVDCGEGPPHPSGFCEADRNCVAKNCECKYNFSNIL